jgi:hypothetical protein
MTADIGHVTAEAGRTYGPIFGRAFLQVALVAWNVENISQRQYALAFFSGAVLSYVWWMNSRTASRCEAPHGRIAYALGAGVGTVCGMALGAWL